MVTSIKNYLVSVVDFILILLLAGTVPASAQTPVFVDVGQCRNISVDLVRVACYDALADQALGRVPPAMTDSAPAQSPDSNNLNRQLLEENWRMREQLARTRKEKEATQDDEERAWIGRPKSGNDENEDGEGEFNDRIAALQKSQDGWVVTLENGQVWRQMESGRYNLREGQEVRIYTTRWGKAYRLTATELGSFIQVERIK